MHFNHGEPGTVIIGDDAFSVASQGIYDDQFFFEGGQSGRLSIEEGQKGFGSWGGIYRFPEPLLPGQEIWFRVRMFLPEGFSYESPGEGGRLKFMRVHTRTPEISNEGSVDWYISGLYSNEVFRFIFEGEQRWKDFGEPADRPTLGRWETWEMYVRLHPVPALDGGQALVRMWKNGRLIAEINDRKTLVSGDSYADRAHLFTYWNGGSPQTQSMWIDTLVITNETPADRDAYGNPYIGAGNVLAAPEPPASLMILTSETVETGNGRGKGNAPAQ